MFTHLYIYILPLKKKMDMKGNVMIKIFFMQIVGFIVGVVPWLRRLMIGSNAPLHVIEDSASMLGYASQINHLYDFGITQGYIFLYYYMQ